MNLISFLQRHWPFLKRNNTLSICSMLFSAAGSPVWNWQLCIHCQHIFICWKKLRTMQWVTQQKLIRNYWLEPDNITISYDWFQCLINANFCGYAPYFFRTLYWIKDSQTTLKLSGNSLESWYSLKKPLFEQNLLHHPAEKSDSR